MKSKIKDFSDKMDEKNEQRIAANKEKVDKSREAIAKSKEGISPEQEYIIGRSVAAKVLSNYKLYNNKEATKYVNEICTAITSSSDMPTLYNGYVVGILDSKEINAISTPGGHILVTKGLLECASSEDAVAAVLAHEIAHIQLRHAAKAIEASRSIQAMKSIAEVASFAVTGGRAKEELEQVADETYTAISITGYSKSQEYQADQKAVTLMDDAGYNPQALKDMLTVLQEKESTQTEGMVKTHPSAKSRLFQVKGYIRNATFGGKKYNESSRTARFNAVKKSL